MWTLCCHYYKDNLTTKIHFPPYERKMVMVLKSVAVKVLHKTLDGKIVIRNRNPSTDDRKLFERQHTDVG